MKKELTKKERELLEREFDAINNTIWDYDHYKINLTTSEIDELMKRWRELNKKLYIS